jgi:beta-glucosidase
MGEMNDICPNKIKEETLMKKLSLLITFVMLFSCIGISAIAEETANPVKTIYIIPAEGEQVELGYVEGTTILEVDGLKFKDLNKNGSLDVYEDWRADMDARIADLYSQMNDEEKASLFIHVNTCGNPAGVDFNDSRNMWEQNCPFDVPAEGEVVTGPVTGGSYSMWYYINVYGVTHFLSNDNGAADLQVKFHNEMQQLGEDTRLGIPITISNDRQYNAWGGMIDTPHDAFGTANDVELSEKLWQQYSKESRAVGIHIVLHPYGQEIGSWNGEDPEYAGTMGRAEINAIQIEDGVYACAKHFIARGGDAAYSTANSDAFTVDNWMTAWRLALEANPKWLMTNGYSTGLYTGVHVDFDKKTMSYLRDTLGYEGVVLSDWGAQGANNSAGITEDGLDLLTLTIPERYAYTINLGLDQIGAPATGIDVENPGFHSDIGAVKEAIQTGLITEERVFDTACRVLATKFELGLFENPYSDLKAALELCANEAYQAEQWPITDNETLMAARPAELIELERQLQAKSAVLVKNNDNLLPLVKGLKVFFGSTAAETTANAIKAAIGDYAAVVDSIEEADVVVADCTQINDAAELLIDDAVEYGKKLVIVTNNVDPNTYVMENGDAVLFMNFTRGADHGTAASGFIVTTEPNVYAEILYGVRVPEGMIVKEIARNSTLDNIQWKDLAGDQGANQWVRMMLLATMKTSENNTTPNNWGDPLLQYKYGMRYGEEPAFEYDTLVLPRVIKEVVTESGGSTRTSYESMVECKVGQPFNLYTLLWNNGADGVTTVQVKDGDTVIAEKIMAVNGGSWRVVEIEIVLDTAGEHTITVGDLSKTINVAE